MSADQELAHALKMKFGTAPAEPSDTQLPAIKSEIQRIQASGKTPTVTDWSAAVSLYCPSAGTCSYFGIDNSDLNTLLALAIQIANRRG
jgi:hypothetical protein